MPRLEAMPEDRVSAVLGHPLSAEMVGTVQGFVSDLRRADGPEELYDYQQRLLSEILNHEERRAQCSRVVKRLNAGASVPRDAIEIWSPEHYAPVHRFALERDVCERAARQLRSVGDALAWRMFGFERQIVIALSRNDSAGPIVGKVGLQAEQALVQDEWKDNGNLVLLRDLTNCLRIGDVSVFTSEGVLVREIKTNPSRQDQRQLRRINAAVNAIIGGEPLPRDGQRLVGVELPYKTHLEILRGAIDLAIERGVQGVKVPGNRALTVAFLPTAISRWSEDEFESRFRSEHSLAMRRARVPSQNTVTVGSLDRSGRAPADPPWAIFPLHPLACALLVTDRIVFWSAISGDSLVRALASEGLQARWLVSGAATVDDTRRPVLAVQNLRRATSMNFSEMNRILYELVVQGPSDRIGLLPNWHY